MECRFQALLSSFLCACLREIKNDAKVVLNHRYPFQTLALGNVSNFFPRRDENPRSKAVANVSLFFQGKIRDMMLPKNVGLFKLVALDGQGQDTVSPVP